MAQFVEIERTNGDPLVVEGHVGELAHVDTEADQVPLPLASGVITFDRADLIAVRDLADQRTGTDWRFPLREWTPDGDVTVIEPARAVA